MVSPSLFLLKLVHPICRASASWLAGRRCRRTSARSRRSSRKAGGQRSGSADGSGASRPGAADTGEGGGSILSSKGLADSRGGLDRGRPRRLYWESADRASR